MPTKKWEKALFIFRRDLRTFDNTGLIFALKHAKEVVAAFIFTPEQIEHNAYLSSHCLQFMIESLEDLQKSLKNKLYFFHGKPEEVVHQLIEKVHIDAVIVNRDYTPYSRKRDDKIASICEKKNIDFQSFEDALLHPPEQILKSDGTPYKVFTPFYRQANRLDVASCEESSHHNYYDKPISLACKESFLHQILPHRSSQEKGGRNEGLKILKKIKNFAQYGVMRDFPFVEGTTHLSAHLKFTTLSVREIYHILDAESNGELIRSLFWRDFFTGIAFHFPHVFEGAFHSKYDKVKWSYDQKKFKRWCEGETGFPIVDAGMREMNATGFMHNRVRMIAASFLVKDLHIDWRLGEKYFAQTLIDYDPAVNNGNWQWVAGTGCDAQPYFRIFNPWRQQEKFDPECLYIKKWVPELSESLPKSIHKGEASSPMLVHDLEAKKALESFKQIS